jgi:hypothetical protein
MDYSKYTIYYYKIELSISDVGENFGETNKNNYFHAGMDFLHFKLV